MGIRVHVLAKELGIDSKVLIAKCQDKGLVRITKHMNTLSDGEARMLRAELAAPSPPSKPVTAPRPPAAAPGPVSAAATARPTSPPKPAAPMAISKATAPVATPSSAPPAGPPKPVPQRPPHPPRPPREVPTVKPFDSDARRSRKPSRDKLKEKEDEIDPEELRARKRRRPKLRDDDTKEPIMFFTDFTASGVYSEAMAGPGVDYQRRARRPRPFGRRRRPQGAAKETAVAELPPEQKKATLRFPVTVRDLSAAIGVKVGDLIAQLLVNGITATINQPLANDIVQMIALEHGWEVTIRERETIEEEVERAAKAQSQEHLEPRIPVVTMLGHVDHGKTSLLDRIRKSNVAASETGGITQHIGAYHVATPGGWKVTFLDTPGHEAFTAMRARGAHCTDVVVLVVAADDGVMPQTIEAISHAHAAEVPIVVALNKVDLPTADPQRVKVQLASHGIELEEWGGDVPCVEVSAHTGKGVDELLEMIHLIAELKDLKANPHKPATGVVLEAHLMEGRGPVATVLVREGTLKIGDVVLCGAAFGRVRAMHNDLGKSVDSAGPSVPVQIAGLSGVPEAGDQMLVVDSLQNAREVAQIRSQRARVASLIERTHVTLENLFGKIAEGAVAEVRVILKADVMGSLEPLKEKLNALSTDEVKIRLLHVGVGAVNESDVLLADASDAIIIAYRVVADARARALAEEKKVDLRFYQIIFQPIDDMRSALSGLLKPERRETVIGHATVLKVFRHSKFGNIAGCQVTDGVITNDARIRIARDGIVILDDAKIASLRRVKDDVREVNAGTECGIRIADFNDIKEADVFEAYRVEEIARTL